MLAASVCALAASHLRADAHSRHYVASPSPSLSWQLSLPPASPPSTRALQTGYRIVASTLADGVQRGIFDAWDSAWQPSNASLGLVYRGAGLAAPGDTIYWSVMLRDAFGAECAPPPPSALVLAPSAPSDWGGAVWITHNSTMQGSDCECYDPAANPAPILRTQFSTPPGSTVVSAHLFVAGLGLHEVFLSGHRVGASAEGSAIMPENSTGFGVGFGGPGAALGDDVLNPPWTTFSKRVLFSAYNVTALLHGAGNNTGGMVQTLGIVLGRGMYDPCAWHCAAVFCFLFFLCVPHPPH